MKAIRLTRGHFAFVDDEDFSRVAAFKWHALIQGHLIYARRGITIGGRRSTQSLHQFILGSEDGKIIDHIDGNGLNNQRANLRFATRSQNCRARHHTTAKSGVVGVTFDPRRAKWRAVIALRSVEGTKGSTVHLGYFSSMEEARERRRSVDRFIHGEFASCA